MFIIPDQCARRIGRQRGFPGARQAKKHRRIGRIANGVVCRTVHRHHPRLWQQIIQQREHRFLVLTRIGGIRDQDQLFVEIHRNNRG